jgi:hypothetical protein
MRFLALVLFLLPAFAAVVAPSAQVSSTFDSDLEGWLIIGDNAGGWVGTGGNPGGYLNVADLATGAGNIASAPPKFLGDWSALTAGDTLSFDVYFVNTSGGGLLSLDRIFRIAGPGGAAKGISPAYTPPQNIWSTYEVSLDPSDWVIESGTWEDIVANVTSLKLYVEYVDGDEEVRVDNVSLSGTPVTVFNPCEHSDFNGTGLDDWSFEHTGTVSNYNDDGNGLGYLYLRDVTATGYAFPPSRFLGDWSTLNNNGYITIDIRVMSVNGTNVGSQEFIRLTGPGGSAYVSIWPDDVPSVGLRWTTFTFPLEESEWTVDSGTWVGLLADVTECRIVWEFYTSTEIIGIDNFGRLASSCPPIDAPVTVYPSGLSLCETYSFVDVMGIMLDPVHGNLHALVRDAGASYDGLYTLIGPNPGIRMHAYDRPAHGLFDAAGNCFISEDYDGRVYRYSGGTSTLWVSGFHGGDDDPFGMAIAPPGFDGPNVNPGDIIVCDRGNSGADQIWVFSPDSTEGERLLTPDPGSVDWFDIAARDDGTVWVTDAFKPDSIFELHPSGVLTGLALSTPIAGMRGIAYDPGDDVLYVCASGAQAVYSIGPATGAVTLVADGFTGVGAAGIEVGYAARRLWVADTGHDRVYEICLPWATAVNERPHTETSDLAMRVVPNPFNPSTTIYFELPEGSHVELAIYDAAGRRVRTLVTRKLRAGPHAVQWGGRDQVGHQAASGVYFARLRAGDANQSRKLVLLK